MLKALPIRGLFDQIEIDVDVRRASADEAAVLRRLVQREAQADTQAGAGVQEGQGGADALGALAHVVQDDGEVAQAGDEHEACADEDQAFFGHEAAPGDADHPGR